MRDVTERAQEDRQIVIGKGGATEPYDATHWTGQWGGAEPRAKPHRTDASAATGTRESPPARSNQRAKSFQAERARRQRRYVALASGLAAVGLLLVVVIPDPDQPKPPQFARAGLASSQVSNTAPPPSNADAAGAQGRAPRIAEAPEPAIQRSQNGERAVAISQELAEARRAIENLTAQLRTQATENDHALAQERARTAALVQEAEAARKELTATRAQQTQALEQERASAAALASQLSTSRQEGEALAAQLRKTVAEAGQPKQADAAKTAQSLEQEQQKAAALAEAEAARRQLTATMAQQHQMLEQERARGAALANQLLAARQETDALTAQLRKVVGETAQLKQSEAARSAQLLQQEQQKATVLSTEADAARQALATATLQHRQALEQERARGAALANQLAVARQDSEALAAQLRKAVSETAQFKQAETARNAQILQLEQQKAAALAEVEAVRQALTATGAEQRQALAEERARGVALANQVSTARQDNEALEAQLRKAQDEAGQSRRAAETTIAELRQTLQQERDRAAAMTSESRAARFGVSGPAATEPLAISQDSRLPQEVAVVEAEQPAVAEAHVSQEAMRLIARAGALLGQGDIGSARIVLERAIEMGSARASFMLAETYDPRILSAWGTYGTRGEVTRARELYVKAQAGGIQEAKDRVGALLR
ncbi:hypothetical protein SAMN05216304_107246 [Bosea sp. OK403]|uniref:hypothetical protein n=1 Tax=Bosea sp. OK403 TaxID=1855286 RepID=UPI0008E471A8|nr:hypothetical protein [Bosea sp. OK403]SFJ41058.1 hypothetical protein SAMN05216304_107246 [Bosea sp. OK403]